MLRVHGWADLVYRKPNGSIGWTSRLNNGVTVEGVNWLLETGFRAGAVPGTLYGGLIAEASYSGVSSADMHSSHSGWGEWTNLSSPTRPAWTPMAANGGLLGTSIAARFNFTNSGQIRGAFLTTIATLGSVAAGVLYNTVVAVDPYDVANGGQLDVSFAVRLGE